MPPLLIIAIALVLLGAIAGGTVAFLGHDAIAAASTFFNGPIGIGIAVAVIIIVAAAAWSQFGAKKPAGSSSNTKGPEQRKP